MPKPFTTTFAQAYAAVGGDLTKRLGDAQAALAGPPLDEEIIPRTDEQTVKAWNARRPEATDEAMQQMAIAKLQEHLQSGMPADKAVKAVAEDLTHFRYGERLKLYTYGQVGFNEQVGEAKRLKRLAERQTTPDPPPPPPTMASAQLTNVQTMQQAPPIAPEQPIAAPTAPSAAGMPPAPFAAPQPSSVPPGASLDAEKTELTPPPPRRY